VLHAIWLALYAFLGKGFAYAGWQPFYVSELLLLLAFGTILSSRKILTLFTTPLGLIMSVFLGWQLICAVPQLETFGVDTLRDSVIWGYATFAWVTAALVLLLPGFVKVVTNWYRRFALSYMIVGPIVWLATIYFRESLPHWPGTDVSIPLIKGGEYCVHLAGIMAFFLTGFARRSTWLVSLVIAEALLGMSTRGGFLAFLLATGFLMLLRPRLVALILVVASCVTLVVTMAAFDLQISMPGASREVSLGQLSSGLVSVVGDSERVDLEGTKSWRLMWWGLIRDYTFNGPYFWTGKGYGINLADSDGFQVGTRDEPLRSPHNSHLTFLARSGVPGFLFWLVLQFTWAWLMLTSHFRARQIGAVFWAALFAWILAYWVAFMVSAGFDVFLEGPMAGIPFWSLFGLGWGSQVVFQTQAGQTTGYRPHSPTSAGLVGVPGSTARPIT
jgi:hypothetical protein